MLSDLEEARKRGKILVDALAEGEVAAASLRLEDQRACINAKRLMDPSGATPEIACREYAEVFKLLNGLSVVEAARDCVKRHGTKATAKTVQDVGTEFMAAKGGGAFNSASREGGERERS